MSQLRDTLNDIIAATEEQRDMEYPRIGEGHAGRRGGIFSLLQNPDNSGAVKTRELSVKNNPDNTARWIKQTLGKLNIPLSCITPWNAVGTYDEELNTKAIKDNLPLCKKLIDVAQPVALVAQGVVAHKTACLLSLYYEGRIICVPHPSVRGRNSYEGADKDIKAAFVAAFKLVKVRRTDC